MDYCDNLFDDSIKPLKNWLLLLVVAHISWNASILNSQGKLLYLIVLTIFSTIAIFLSLWALVVAFLVCKRIVLLIYNKIKGRKNEK